MNAFVAIGYFIWFTILVRLLFLSTSNPYINNAEALGSHLGLAFWLLVLSLIPYFIARALAKKKSSQISWLYVMVGTTIIALTLALGGMYGRLNSSKINTMQPGIPALSDQSPTNTAQSSKTETSPLAQYQQPLSALNTSNIQNNPTDQISSSTPAAQPVIQMPTQQVAPTTTPQSAVNDQRFQRKSVGVDYTRESNEMCWKRYQDELSKISQDAPLADYARSSERAQNRLDVCVQ